MSSDNVFPLAPIERNPKAAQIHSFQNDRFSLHREDRTAEIDLPITEFSLQRQQIGHQISECGWSLGSIARFQLRTEFMQLAATLGDRLMQSEPQLTFSSPPVVLFGEIMQPELLLTLPPAGLGEKQCRPVAVPL